MKCINVIFLAFIVVSCRPTIEERESKVTFFEGKLLSTSEEALLNIYYQSDECGEWGGHEELIDIRRKNRDSYELTYTEYRVNCDSMVNEFYQVGNILRPSKELVRTINVEMTESRKRAILNFSTDMVQSKFREPFAGHSGVIIGISNWDSTFVISTWGGTDKHYLDLVNNLKLDLIE